ncbi:class I SAM-dependent methyltransferase [Anthocerotibacter panamensis]|uniref:class I SAM-dependent methyltransferase n=1 Tax=Anthocerotibacter panamensis TaxID=2857077 RepID=UPI001C408C5F|nr:class I SAM-dependent methyltransferase [Anthocerotibacter panamensis]
MDYLYCSVCGLLQTEEPYWLEEAYSQAIAAIDIGLIARNIGVFKRLASLLYCCYEHDGKYQDIAGGYGMLTRLMRDIGFDFYWSDPYCSNIFAKEFEASKTEPKFCAITAFEVLEHVYDPLDFISQALANSSSRTLIFSTALFQGDPPPLGQWWYYSPETGQHITFYQARTLQFIANRLGLNFHTNRDFHLLTNRSINPLLFKVSTSKAAHFTIMLVKPLLKSRMDEDCRKIQAILSVEQAKSEHKQES